MLPIIMGHSLSINSICFCNFFDIYITTYSKRIIMSGNANNAKNSTGRNFQNHLSSLGLAGLYTERDGTSSVSTTSATTTTATVVTVATTATVATRPIPSYVPHQPGVDITSPAYTLDPNFGTHNFNIRLALARPEIRLTRINSPGLFDQGNLRPYQDAGFLDSMNSPQPLTSIQPSQPEENLSKRNSLREEEEFTSPSNHG